VAIGNGLSRREFLEVQFTDGLPKVTPQRKLLLPIAIVLLLLVLLLIELLVLLLLVAMTL